MAYGGSAAYQLDSYQSAWEAPVRRPLSVHEGGHRDARSRQQATSHVATIARVAVTLAVVFAVLGAVRVALTVATVSCLKDISTAEGVVAAERVTRTELQVERSALSSADRIQRIATQNYGMVYATDVETITLPAQAGDEASADAAQTVDDANDTQPMA